MAKVTQNRLSPKRDPETKPHAATTPIDHEINENDDRPDESFII